MLHLKWPRHLIFQHNHLPQFGVLLLSFPATTISGVEVCVFEIYVHKLHTFTSYKYESVYSDVLVGDIKQVNPNEGTVLDPLL